MITSEPQEGLEWSSSKHQAKAHISWWTVMSVFFAVTVILYLLKMCSEEQIQHQFHTPDGLGLVLQCPYCEKFNELIPLT